MSGPRIICAGCGSLSDRILCKECSEAYFDGQEIDICRLCEAGFKRNEKGEHLSATGGYAGKCTAPGVQRE